MTHAEDRGCKPAPRSANQVIHQISIDCCSSFHGEETTSAGGDQGQNRWFPPGPGFEAHAGPEIWRIRGIKLDWMLLFQDFYSRRELWASSSRRDFIFSSQRKKYENLKSPPLLPSACVVQPQLRLCDSIVLCGLCGAERSEAGCRGNKLQLLSILRHETRTAKETVIRSLPKCSTKWLHNTSMLTRTYFLLSYTVYQHACTR